MGRKPKHIFTAEMDDEITRSYQQNISAGGLRASAPVRALSKKLGIPRASITARAAYLGVIPVTRTSKAWSEEEITILEHHAHKSLYTIQYHLEKSGFARTVQSIRHKMTRTKLRKNLKGQSAASLALCFGVNPLTVTRWLHAGLLEAKRRGTKRKKNQGGDAWFVTDRQVRDFVISHVAIIDFRKIDKYWLVDLLAGGYYGLGPIAEEYRVDNDDFAGEEHQVDPGVSYGSYDVFSDTGGIDWF